MRRGGKIVDFPQDMLTLTDLSSVTLNLNPTTQEESIVDSKLKHCSPKPNAACCISIECRKKTTVMIYWNY